MSTIVTRAGKSSPLTNAEVDSNFTNLNTDKVESITSADGSVVVSSSGTTRDLSVGTAANTGTLISQVRNETGATLTKGTVVYISGAAGNKALVSKALATGDTTSAQTYGMVQADIPHNQNGYVVVIGAVSGLNTSAFTDGTQLYLSGVSAGGYTNTKPYAPTHLVYVGIVTYSHATQGTIQVKIQNGYELDEIHDVSARSPVNGQTLVYVSSTGLWTKTDQSSMSVGSAATLATARNINGVSFNGSADITVADATKLPLTGGTLTGKLTLDGRNEVYGVPTNAGTVAGFMAGTSGGTSAARTQSLNTQTLFKIEALGYTGTGWTGGAGLSFVATENITATNRGTKAVLSAITAGSDTATTLEWDGSALTLNGSTAVTSSNYNNYAPTKTGTGASGTWAINITGNAATATSATDSTKLPLSGGTLSGSLTFSNTSVQRKVSVTIDSRGVWDGTLNGYLLLAKAYVSGNQANSEVTGRVFISRGDTSSGRRSETIEVFSKSAYQSENFLVNWPGIRDFTAGTLHKVTYNGTVYHAIRLSQTGGGPYQGFAFDGYTVNAGLIVALDSEVTNVSSFGSIGLVIDSTGGTILANAFRFYTGGSDGSSAYGDFRTNPATGNTILSAKTGSLYFNYDHGTGGVIFCNGAAGAVGTVDSSGNANFVGAITQNGSQVLHAGNYGSYALPLSGGTITGQITGGLAAGSQGLDFAVNDNYASMRVIRNNSAGPNNRDGMYIGYQNSNSGLTRIFGGGAGSGGIQISGSGVNDVTIAGNTAINAGNYSSYALPLSGGTLTGRLISTASASADNYAGVLRIAPSSIEHWGGIAFPDTNAGTSNANNYWFYGRGTAISDRTLTTHIPSYSDYSSTGAIPSWGVYRTGAVSLFRVWADGSVTAGGNQILHAGNYSSYALPLSGGTLTGSLNVGFGGGDLLIRSTAANDLGDIVWANYAGTEVHRLWDGGSGLQYRKDAGTGYLLVHAGNYSSYALPLTGGTVSGGVVIDGGASNQTNDATLYVTASNSNDWGIRIGKSSADYGYLAELASGAVYGLRVLFGGVERLRIGDSSQTISGNQILHAGNYTSYAYPSYTQPGGTATPTGGLNGASQGWAALDGYGTAVPNYGGTDWWVGVWTGGNSTRGIQIAGGYSDVDLYFRKGADGWTPWRRVLNSANYNSYSPTLTGGNASGTWGINISGNLTASAPQLAAATESNSIYVSAPSYTSGSPVKLLNFDWYGNTWAIGNIRSGATPSDGFGVYFQGSEKGRWSSSGFGFQVGTAATYDNPGGWNANIVASGQYHARVRIKATSYNSSGDNEAYLWVDNSVSPRSGLYSSTAFNMNVAGGLYESGSRVLNSSNYSSYALPLTGGTLSGTLTANAGIYSPKVGISSSNLSDTVNGAPWYGIGATDLTFGATQVPQFAGYYGLRIRTAGTIMDFAPSGDPGSINVSAGGFKISGNVALHAGNYTSFNGHIRSLGYPSSSNDWNSLGNTYENSVIQVDPSNFSSTPNGPTAASYTYGTLLSYASGSNSQAQIFISHAGNDLIFRGGWGGGSWQTWNKALTNQNYSSYAVPISGGTMTGVLTTNHQGNGSPSIIVNSGGSENWRAINVRAAAGGDNFGIGYSNSSHSALGRNNLSFHCGAGDSIRFHSDGWDTMFEVAGATGNAWFKNDIYFGGSSAYTFGRSVWAGTGGYPGYSYTGGNHRFGFSSTSGYIDVYTDGDFYAGVDFNGVNNKVLHAGNYTSYSPSLGGSGAGGTWGINITGSAQVSNTLSNYGYGSGQQTWYQTSGNFQTWTGGWASHIISNHGDGATYYNQTIIMPFWSAPQYMRKEGGTNVGPWTFVTTENYTSYTVPVGGGTFTGSITSNGNVTAYSDERKKTNWRGFAEDFIDQLATVKSGTYDRTDMTLTQDGVSAQSLQQVMPNSVFADEHGMLSVNYGGAALASAVELAKEVVDLRIRVAQLESLISKLIGD